MKKYFQLLVSFLIIISTACSSDEPIVESIVGTWYGTKTYYNPAGGRKYQNLSMSFESNGTGTLEYESPVSYSVAKYKYKINGKKITCNGAYVNTYGDIETDFSMTLSIEGDRLIPGDKFNSFILTRDNSVMTDGDGNEIIDQSNLIQQVWVRTSGETVTVFEESTYVEYVLSSPFSKTYTRRYSGTYSYDASRKTININGTEFDIITLTSSYLSLKSKSSGNVFNYNAGGEDDIPKSEEELYSGTVNGHDWVDLGLPSHTKWATTNIGAKNETEPGSYFAWGETTPKTIYKENTYEFELNGVYSVYIAPTAPENEEGLYILRDKDNAAYVNWGTSWDMPTIQQLEELEKYCTVINNGSYLTITGPNGRSIKFPLGSHKYDNNLIWNYGNEGYIMSKELTYKKYANSNSPWGAAFLGGFKNYIYTCHYVRYYGYNIRPVLKN